MNKKYLLFVALFFSINSYADDFETEPNNSKQEADPIVFDVPINGNIYGSEKDDWFSFDVKGSNVLSIITSSQWEDISVFDDKKNLLYKETAVTKNEPMLVGISGAGKYFIRIEGGLGIRSDYTLTIGLENVEPHSNPAISSGTVSLNLDIHMPSLDYQSLAGNQNIWADFSYSGLNGEGEHIWVLKKYGANE